MKIPVALVARVLSGGMFGFFYAWVCSMMWGLDAADPRVAMQAMNASVRNAVFAPAFFGTGPALLLAACLARREGAGTAALTFGAAACLYRVGPNAVTFVVSVPTSDALADLAVPDDAAGARAAWSGFSPRWQLWNQLRAVFCGGVLLLAGVGLMQLSRAGPAPS